MKPIHYILIALLIALCFSIYTCDQKQKTIEKMESEPKIKANDNERATISVKSDSTLKEIKSTAKTLKNDSVIKKAEKQVRPVFRPVAVDSSRASKWKYLTTGK